MLLPTAFARPSQQTRHSRLFKGLLIGALSTSLLLTGCNKPTDPDSSEASFTISGNQVNVSHNLILTSIPERYQPSFNLEGTLVPALSTDVEMPYDIISGALAIKEGDEVVKGEVLAELKIQATKDELQNLASDTVDVYINEVKIEPKKTPRILTLNRKPEPKINTTTAETSQAQQATSNQSNEDKKTAVTASQPSSNQANSNQASSTEPDKSATGLMSNFSEQLINAKLVIKSPIAGEITHIKNKEWLNNIADTKIDDTAKTDDKSVSAQDAATHPIIHIDSTHDLQLIGELPLTTQSQLSVGRSVSFTVYDLQTEFAGQISHIIPDMTTNKLTVRASLTPGEHKNSERLEPGMAASMRIEYGQIELGVRLPRKAIHEANLDKLSAQHPRPTSPIKGYVWVVQQDQSLSYNPVQVVQYFADSDKFLVSGINNDSLVCLADLPKTAAGKILTVD